MEKMIEATTLRKCFQRLVRVVALGSLLIGGSLQPSYANDTNGDAPEIVTQIRETAHLIVANAHLAEVYLKDAYDVVQDQLKEMQSSWATAVEAIGKNLQARINSMLVQNHMTSDRQNVAIKSAMEINHESYRPKSDNVCSTAESVHQLDVADSQVKQIAQATAGALSNRPMHPGAVATEIANECTMKFAPTNSGDPQASAYMALNPSCVNDPNHARQDRSIEALLDPTQYPIPPNFPLPKNGVWSQLKTVSAEKYYPFAAALSYCQNVTPPLPTPPQGVAGKPTAALLMVNAYKTAESQTSVAPGSCFDALYDRVQAGTDAPAWQNMHNEQVKLCTEDHTTFVIDDTEFADCQTNGRSHLQALRDKDYETGNGAYQTNVLSVVQFDTKQLLLSHGIDHMNEYEQNRIAERAQIVNSIGIARQAASSVSNVQGQGVQ